MSWVAAAIIGGSVVGAGGSLIAAGMNGGAPGIEDNYVQGPNYQQGETNLSNTANWLNQAQSQPDYGAIQPDWSDIWNQTQQQVQNYFSGTATQPGVNDQINASFAQRGMSGDPAASYLQAASGANEAQDLGNLSAQQNIAQNQFGLQGQQQWLDELNAYQTELNPSMGSWTGAQPYATTDQQIGNAISGVGTAAATYGLQQNSANNQMTYLQSILNPTTTSGYPASVGGSGSVPPESF